MHLTAYRLIDELTDGPCSVVTFVKYPSEAFLFTYITAESSNQDFINKLLNLKKAALKWKSREFYCEEGILGGETIPHMFVISGTFTDTIFTDKTNQWIIFPDKQKAYFNKDRLLNNAFTGSCKDLFGEFLNRQINAVYRDDYEQDSIPANSISYQGKPLDMFIDNFNNDHGTFKLLEPEANKWAAFDTAYYSESDTIYFSRDLIAVVITNPDSGWDINGIKQGDAEKKLIDKYPVSTQIPLFSLSTIRIEDIKRLYYYRIRLKDEFGSLIYDIKDNKIEKVTIYIWHGI
ncbi:hypothetical protein AM493_15390 [Flavobacterium akiainvivens]|uniref:Uncharacterized protein n=2 Tax=Flavobacterium akiainvivens TaxID=1202724 RepID=A0A0M9VJ00_9FLAO|nr:hypothetical protein AM493_15390 [Flavobacterium akiainvivens]